MRFTVPKFLEREAKIIGSLTFKQFLYFGLIALVLTFIYLAAPRHIFIFSLLFLAPIAFAFAFVRVEGQSLSETIGSFISYLLSPKIFLWQRKESLGLTKIVKAPEKKKKKEDTGLKIASASLLRKLRSKIEIGKR